MALDDHLLVRPGRPRAEVDGLLSRTVFLEEQGEVATRARGSDREFDSLREYVAGDEIRRIDWKASGRRHRPQVRQYRSAEVTLALDCGRLMGSVVDARVAFFTMRSRRPHNASRSAVPAV